MVKIKALGSTLLSLVLLLLAAAGTAYLSFFSDYMPAGSGTINSLPFDYGLTAAFSYFINIWRPSQFPHALSFVSLILLLIAIFSLLILFIMALAKKRAFLFWPALLFAVELACLSFVLILVIPMVQMRVLGAIPTAGMAGVIGFILFALVFAVAPLSPLIKDFFNGIKRMAGAKPSYHEAAEPAADLEAVRALIKAELGARLVDQPVEESAPVAEDVIAEDLPPVEEVEKPAEEVAEPVVEVAEPEEPVVEVEEPVVEVEEEVAEDEVKEEADVAVVPAPDEVPDKKARKAVCEGPEEKKGFKHSVFRGLRALLSTLISAVFLAGAAGITLYLTYFSDFIPAGTGNIDGQAFNYGLEASIGYFLNVWRPSQFPHVLSFICLILLLIAAVLTLVFFVAAVVRFKILLILPTALFAGSVGALTFIIILVIPMIEMGVLRIIPMLGMAGAFGLSLFALAFAYAPISPLLKSILCGIQKFAGVERPSYRKPPVVQKLDDDVVRALIEEELEALPLDKSPCEEETVEESDVDPDNDAEPALEAQKEPDVDPDIVEEPILEVKEEPVVIPVKAKQPVVVEKEQPKVDKGDADVASADASLPESLIGIVGKGKRKRPTFETRLKNSENDLRHKYYDLRDYLEWYGFRKRISQPGATFSMQRQRYAFVTIVGKHARLYIGLDPEDYVDTTIPIEKAEAKKYEDIPCLLRIRSDLSYRRAKKLIDDLAVKIGLPMPTSKPPKETQ